MNEELDLLKVVSARLESQSIPHMVTGSIASNLYTVPRMTRDIDIVLDVTVSDSPTIVSLFSDDFYIEAETVTDEIRRRGMFNIVNFDNGIKVDFIVRKQSEYRVLEFARRRTVALGDFRISVVSLEDLILSKLYWAKDSLSELQLGDVRKLLASRGDIDEAYLREWIGRLRLEAVHLKAIE